MNPQPARQSAMKTVRAMAQIPEPQSKKCRQINRTLPKTPGKKSGAIREEFISAV
jgi:hypothetical protein